MLDEHLWRTKCHQVENKSLNVSIELMFYILTGPNLNVCKVYPVHTCWTKIFLFYMEVNIYHKVLIKVYMRIFSTVNRPAVAHPYSPNLDWSMQSKSTFVEDDHF